MTAKDKFVLQHNRQVVYLQILAGMVIALIAAQAFSLFEIKSQFLNGVIVVNNFVVGFIIGVVGFFFIRNKLKQIEEKVCK